MYYIEEFVNIQFVIIVRVWLFAINDLGLNPSGWMLVLPEFLLPLKINMKSKVNLF